MKDEIKKFLFNIQEASNSIFVFPIKNARRIVNLRNYVIHGYDKVDNVIIWGIISRDLPELKKEIEKQLEQ